MLLSSRIYTSRNDLPRSCSARVGVAPSAVLTLDAPEQVVISAPGRPRYEFLFWQTDEIVVGEHIVTFAAPAGEGDFHATAWYRRAGERGPAALPCPPCFEEAEADPQALSATTGLGAVMVTARSLVAGFGQFVAWLPLRGIRAASA